LGKEAGMSEAYLPETAGGFKRDMVERYLR
jgi:hypothetical protein